MSLDASVVFAPIIVGARTIMHLGTNAFSTPPTIAEINASSDWWQVFALYNRRASQVFSSPTLLSLPANPQNLPTAGNVNALQTQINILRTALGYTAYSFTAVSPGGLIRATDLTALRTALSITGSFVATLVSNYRSYLREIPYNGTIISGPIQNQQLGSGNYYGKRAQIGGMERSRYGCSFAIPSMSGLKAPLAGTITFAADRWSNLLESNTAVIYASSSDDSAIPTGWYNNLNIACGSVAYNTTDPFFPGSVTVPATAFASARGRNLSFVIGEDAELTGSGVGTGGAFDAAGFGGTVYVGLTYNFGF